MLGLEIRRSFLGVLLLVASSLAGCGAGQDVRGQERSEARSESFGGEPYSAEGPGAPRSLRPWLATLPAVDQARATGRLWGHHVRVQARSDALLRFEQAEAPELTLRSPVLEYPAYLPDVSSSPRVVLACVIESSGLIAGCVDVYGDPRLTGYVRRVVMLWRWLPALDHTGQERAGSYFFDVPFLL